MYPEEICEELMNHCLAPDCQMGGLGGDNMTVVLVCFLHNKPYAELVARCASSSTTTTMLNNTTTTTTTNTNQKSSSSSTPSSPEDEEEELDLK